MDDNKALVLCVAALFIAIIVGISGAFWASTTNTRATTKACSVLTGQELIDCLHPYRNSK